MEPSNYYIIALVFAAGTLVSLGLTRLVRAWAIQRRIGVFPNERMVHTGFIPRMGGIGIIGGFLVALILSALLFHSYLQWEWPYVLIVSGALLMGGLGIYDDRYGLNAPQKFAGQFLAATLVILGGCRIDVLVNPFGLDLNLGWFSIPLTYLWLITVTNAVNLLDGLDGLAAGVSFIAALVFGLIAFLHNNMIIVVFSVSLMAGLLGFLRYNRHPASIFMGDTGSLFLGFLLAALSLKAFTTAGNHIEMLLPVIVLAVPIGDTTVAFFRRLNNGRHPFKPDKDHLHHRLLYLGLTHRQAVQIIYFAAAAYGLAAIILVLEAEISGLILLLLVIVLSVFGLKRLGYLEARKFKTVTGSEDFLRIQKELAPISIKRFLHRLLLGLSDVLMVNLALYVYVWLRHHYHIGQGGVLDPGEILTPVPMLIVTLYWIVLFILNDLYSMRWDISRFDKMRRISKTILVGILLWFIITWDGALSISEGRMAILLYAGLLLLFVNLGRLLVISFEKRGRILEYAPQNTLLIGATSRGHKLLKDIRKNPHLLYNVVGYVTQDGRPERFSNLSCLGTYEDIPSLIRNRGIHEVIIAINEQTHDELIGLIAAIDDMKVVLKIVPQYYDILSGHKTEEITGHPLIRLFPDHMRMWQWLLKRLADIVLSLFFLTLFFLPALLLALLLTLTGVHPPLVIENRMGKNGRVFGQLNFNVQGRSPLQRWLYKTNIYKLPELINILLGSMSWVGPRPESPDKVERLRSRIKFYNRRFQIRPGLTGWAQVRYRYDDSMRSHRDQHKQDLFYLENMSLTFDLRILLRSLVIFFFKRSKSK
ncbi:MAG TPA: hypothetical protein ENK44_01690 [Caldithrix abyssi]|uniref:Bacterial sugar transferase domain-containing protein n=1 Tax=Caldithrix abyssi TaxID=187145 RepID=A0A7V4WUJ6_CALAY|nr:hypothetical protein [Caldithrix abyssi]